MGQTDPYGHEFWSARELMPLLGYDRWQNFEKAIERAKIACQESGDDVSRCFTDASKTSDMPRGGVKELKEKKGVPGNEEYLDRVGSRELSAIDFKNTLATGKLQDDHVEREDQAIDTHYQAGQVVREAIEKMKQPLPETLPTEPSIRKLVEERRRKQQKKRKLPSPDEQERLF